jgi:hypothetical protein
MRLGRIILAGLAPLVSLSAFAAGFVPDSYSPSKSAQQLTSADSMSRLFQAVVPLLISAAESASAAPLESRTAHAVFTLEALTSTLFRHSLWLLASGVAVNFFHRGHQTTLLRC